MKNLKNALLLLFGLSLISSCSQIVIKDQEYCADAGPLGASCVHTQTDETRDLTPAEWQVERFGMVCSTGEAYSDNVAVILKACRICKCCSYDAKKKITKFKKNLETFQEYTLNIKQDGLLNEY